MATPVRTELRNQIRGITGALLVVGLTFHYTMETWWLGWTLPMPYLVGYALVGLTAVVLIDRVIGFHRGDEGQDGASKPWWYAAVVDFSQIFMQSIVASYSILLVIGILDLGSSLNLVVRLGLVEVVPLGFGAALANRMLSSSDEAEASREQRQFPHNLAIFAVGAIFVSSTIAPTQEVELIAAHMGWLRHVALVALTLVVVYLVLYEVEFRGHHARVQKEPFLQVGTVFLVYLVAVVTSFFLLMGFGHFIEATVALVYQETVVLAFPAAVGAAAAEVVI